MNKVRHLPYYFYIVILCAFFSSCSPARKVIKEPIKEEGATYLFKQLKNSEVKFDWLSARFNVEMIIDKKKTSFSGQLRIHKDSVMWISITKLGFEVARVLITNDSVKFINRIDNNFYIGPFDYINKFINTAVDFDMLQSLLLGNDFTYYETDQFKASLDNKQYKLSTLGRHKLKKYIHNEQEKLKVLIQNIWLDPERFKINRVMVKEIKENRKLEATYSNYETIENQIMPQTIDFDVVAEENIIKISIQYSKIKINTPQTLPFIIPESYKSIQ